MMVSMFASVSGLKSHQTKMDVIGNNVANVNTVGFKAARTTFQEIFAQTLSSGSAPDSATGRGGTNPMQIGLGMTVDSISTDMGRGSVQRTESPSDLSIEGEGFFIVRSGNSGEFLFTRAGNFTFDVAGNLVTSSGKNVYGWMDYEITDDGYVFKTQDPIQPINLYEFNGESRRIMAARATTEAVLAGNLDATSKPVYSSADDADVREIDDSVPATDGNGIPDKDGKNVEPHYIVPIHVYDVLGNEYKLNINFWKTYVYADEDQRHTRWYYLVTPEGSSASAVSGGNPAAGYLCFDATGKLVTNDQTNFPTSIKVEVTPPGDSGAGIFEFTLDLSRLTQYADDNSVSPSRVDGYPPGKLINYTIGDDGVITGIYDNGRRQPLAMIALAVFENPAGLEKVGSNEFRETANSGAFSVAAKPGTNGAGKLVPGTLEMSNVDLAAQFTEMIITQRGFQANSRVLTTADEILQELANLKR
ncbi:MAG TPA: flagellar hook protein FlgE [Thermoclostridium caenicola]|nr:flagellar hook protein FlgE [Thermoclostridium caenicola]